jgi:hypothetical protein
LLRLDPALGHLIHRLIDSMRVAARFKVLSRHASFLLRNRFAAPHLPFALCHLKCFSLLNLPVSLLLTGAPGKGVIIGNPAISAYAYRTNP